MGFLYEGGDRAIECRRSGISAIKCYQSVSFRWLKTVGACQRLLTLSIFPVHRLTIPGIAPVDSLARPHSPALLQPLPFPKCRPAFVFPPFPTISTSDSLKIPRLSQSSVSVHMGMIHSDCSESCDSSSKNHCSQRLRIGVTGQGR